jgi:hypothetical protein
LRLLPWRLLVLLLPWRLLLLGGLLCGERLRLSTGVGLAILLAPVGYLLLAHEWRFLR